MKTNLSDTEIETCIKQVLEVRKKAYAPYSNYTVGAVIVDEDGQTYSGCNVENAAFPASVCAEVNAITSMVAKGAKKIKAVFVVGPEKDHFVSPCGNCRQVIREFASGDTMIYSIGLDGQIGEMHSLESLLPYSFGPNRLK